MTQNYAATMNAANTVFLGLIFGGVLVATTSLMMLLPN